MKNRYKIIRVKGPLDNQPHEDPPAIYGSYSVLRHAIKNAAARSSHRMVFRVMDSIDGRIYAGNGKHFWQNGKKYKGLNYKIECERKEKDQYIEFTGECWNECGKMFDRLRKKIVDIARREGFANPDRALSDQIKLETGEPMAFILWAINNGKTER